MILRPKIITASDRPRGALPDVDCDLTVHPPRHSQLSRPSWVSYNNRSLCPVPEHHLIPLSLLLSLPFTRLTVHNRCSARPTTNQSPLLIRHNDLNLAFIYRCLVRLFRFFFFFFLSIFILRLPSPLYHHHSTIHTFRHHGRNHQQQHLPRQRRHPRPRVLLPCPGTVSHIVMALFICHIRHSHPDAKDG